MPLSASAKAYSNIALIKYWGKREPELNLPAVGSISVTLDALSTNTTVDFLPDLKSDQLILNGKPAAIEKTTRIQKFLNIIRVLSGIRKRANVTSENNFPTGAGLASSASAFAALTMAATAASGLHFSRPQLSALARRGSGSAARSIFGGFAEMVKGESPDGSDSHAIQLADEYFWPLRILIAITTEEEKPLGSTSGMEMSAATSIFYKSWMDSSDVDLADMRLAIKNKDFQKLGELSEYSCLKMHSVMMSSRPALIYWNRITMDIINLVRDVRNSGIPAYFTIDAGPQVKIITLPDYEKYIRAQLNSIKGIKRIISSGLGSEAILKG